MSRVSLVGLTGHARSGKTSVAEAFAHEHGWSMLSFADPLREMALAVNPYIAPKIRLRDAVNDVGWREAKDTYPEVRRFLEALGTDGVRHTFGSDTWLQHAVKRIHMGLYYTPGVIIDDVRFENEAELIKSFGGVVVRINRDGVFSSSKHISATTRVDTCCAVGNNGEVQEAAETLWRCIS